MRNTKPLKASSVFVRVRPDAPEGEGGHQDAGDFCGKALHSFTKDTIRIMDSHGLKDYTFAQNVFQPDATQAEVFETAMPNTVSAFLGEPKEGVNPIDVLFFAYGQTGTGKTHTMFGLESSLKSIPSDGLIDPGWGVFPRTVYETFRVLQSRGNPFVVSMSAVEFYLMQGFDLLNDLNPVVVNMDNTITGLQHVILRQPSDVFHVLSVVRAKRHTRSTLMNTGTADHSGSSRSHAALILNVTQSDPTREKCVSTAFNLVDLAGAERPNTTGAERMSGLEAMMDAYRGNDISTGAQGAMINMELTFLMSQIVQATDRWKSGYVFKAAGVLNTAALRYLGSCMTGKAALNMIVCLSQSSSCGWETWFSCTYGERLAQLRAAYIRASYVPFKKEVREAQRTLDETSAAIEKCRAKDRFYEKRAATILHMTNRLAILRALEQQM